MKIIRPPRSHGTSGRLSRHLRGKVVGFGERLPPSVSLVICFHRESPEESSFLRFFPTWLRRPAGLQEGGCGDSLGYWHPRPGQLKLSRSLFQASGSAGASPQSLKTQDLGVGLGKGAGEVTPFPLPPSLAEDQRSSEAPTPESWGHHHHS